MIDETVAEMYRDDEANRFLEVTYQNGDKEILYYKDFSSGAMIENIVRRAKKLAIKRVIGGGAARRHHAGPARLDQAGVQGARGPAEHHEPRRLGEDLGQEGRAHRVHPHARHRTRPTTMWRAARPSSGSRPGSTSSSCRSARSAGRLEPIFRVRSEHGTKLPDPRHRPVRSDQLRRSDPHAVHGRPARQPRRRRRGRWRAATRTSSPRSRPTTGAEVDRITVDADDADALAEMCAHTNLVISTVGPYALYGSKLVAAVAEAGIDYVDLTGEPQWMQRMIDRYQDRAVETGARLVHACGFDSVPSDMGVWFLQREAQRAVRRTVHVDQHGRQGCQGRSERGHDRLDDEHDGGGVGRSEPALRCWRTRMRSPSRATERARSAQRDACPSTTTATTPGWPRS